MRQKKVFAWASGLIMALEAFVLIRWSILTGGVDAGWIFRPLMKNQGPAKGDAGRIRDDAFNFDCSKMGWAPIKT